MDAGKLLRQLHHAVVVLQGMQPYPGKAILAGDHVFVERLVHVPEQHQPDFRGILAHRILNCGTSVTGDSQSAIPRMCPEMTRWWESTIATVYLHAKGLTQSATYVGSTGVTHALNFHYTSSLCVSSPATF